MATPGGKATTKLTNDALAFLTERHLAMLTTLRSDQSPHVVAVGFTFDPKTHIARVITTGGSQKAVNADQQGVAVLSQVDGARWLSLEGKATVHTDIEAVRDAELRYAQRYRTPRPNPRRVVIEVRIERVLGSSSHVTRAGDAQVAGVPQHVDPERPAVNGSARSMGSTPRRGPGVPVSSQVQTKVCHWKTPSPRGVSGRL